MPKRIATRSSTARWPLRWRGLLVAALLSAAALSVGVLVDGYPRQDSTSAPATRPNIVLISLDTTRADHLSAYGYGRPTTPRLAALLATSVRFDAAYAPMATTLPSHGSMFTGLYPRTHGVLQNGVPLPEGLPTLAAALAAAGYHTAGFVSAYPLHHRFRPNRGFETWDDDFRDAARAAKREIRKRRDVEREASRPGAKSRGNVIDAPGSRREGSPRTREEHRRRGAETRARAVAWLETNGHLAAIRSGETQRRPFFLFVHLFDAHAPYAPPPRHAALFPTLVNPPTLLDRNVAAYDAEIHYADEQVGLLLDRIAEAGLLDDTLVVIVADHGEGLMQHGWMSHGFQLYEEAVRVPLLMRWPARFPGGRSISTPVELVDLAPTLLDLAGVEAGDLRGEGRSQARVVTGEELGEPERPVFLQRRFYERGAERGGETARGPKVAVRVGQWKYIEAEEEGTRELYDLDGDPGELTNLVDRHPSEAARLAATLAAWVAKRPTPAAERVSDEDAERLRALGYVQ